MTDAKYIAVPAQTGDAVFLIDIRVPGHEKVDISPMPFNWIEEPWQLPAGESVQLKYRVAVFAGDPGEAELDELYQQWAEIRS